MRVVIHDYAGHPFVVGLSRGLAERGHEVVHAFASGLLTPRGTLERQAEDPEGLRFCQLQMDENYRRDKYRFAKRRKYEKAYGYEFAKLLEVEAPDLVISGNTPSEPQWLAVKKARELDIPFVSWVQDFYSIAVRKLAAKKLALLGGIAGWYYTEIDRKCFENSAAIVGISEDFSPILAEYKVPSSKIVTIENWGALEGIPVRPKSNPWSLAHALADKKVLAYSGTLAMKHNPEPLLQLATRLRDRQDVRVLLVSEGPGAEYVRDAAVRQGLSNLLVFPFQPFETLPDLLGTADLFLALLEPDAGIFSVPSKILSYLCAGKPVVAAMPKENLAARLLERIGAGSVVAPSDGEGFVEAAIALLDDPNRCREMGLAGRSHAEAHFDINKVCDRFELLFEQIIHGYELRVDGAALSKARAS